MTHAAANQLPSPPANIYIALHESSVIQQMMKAFMGEKQTPVEIESKVLTTHFCFEGPMSDAE